MTLKAARFVNLILVALTLGMTFCHALDAFGPVGGAIEVLAVATTWAVLAMVRGRKAARTLTLIAAVCVSGALIVWTTTVAPMNTVFNGWTAASLPVNWTSYRNQWEIGHAVSALLFAIAFGTLVSALLNEIPNRTD